MGWVGGWGREGGGGHARARAHTHLDTHYTHIPGTSGSTSTFETFLWVYYCPGHAGVQGTDSADRLAGKAKQNATITGGLMRLGRYEVLRSLRH